jgi:DNA-binding NtrC family response regulator
MDVDDLRRDFQRYQERQLHGREVSFSRGEDGLDEAGFQEVFTESPETVDLPDEAPAEPREETGAVLYRPGMTMEEVEEETIRAVLEEVGGNRRRAAERLEIGERTLYRKIKKFGLED